jgi:hypothetical protein
MSFFIILRESMVRKCFGLFLAVCLVVLSSSALFAQSQLVTANQIMITNHGIMVNINGQGQIHQSNAVVHVGNRVYEIDAEYYGSCGSCGWPLTQSGKCSNKNCNQYGPKERD